MMQEIERLKTAVKDGTLPEAGQPSHKDRIEQVPDTMQGKVQSLYCA